MDETSVLGYFPDRIAKIFRNYLNMGEDDRNFETLEEIRLRTDKAIIFKFNKGEKVFDNKISFEEIVDTLQLICENSIYSFQNQICNGYITIKGGHRVGVVGSCVIEKNKIININYVSGLNFRIAKQIIGCSNKVLEYVVDKETNSVHNTLIVSPPGAGKTTILRDLIKQISDGIPRKNFSGLNVGVVDERGEIAAMYKSVAQNDIGIRTDVLDNAPKAIGMKMLIRSMTPDVICADEIGSVEDTEAINYAICSGIKGIFTAHGGAMEDLSLNLALSNLINSYVFERIIFLSTENPKGEVDKAYLLNKKISEYVLME